MLWVGVGGRGRWRGSDSLSRRVFSSIWTASRSVDIIRHRHESNSVKGYEPGVLRVLTASPTILLAHSTYTTPSHPFPRYRPDHSPLVTELNRVPLRFRIRSVPHQCHSFIHLPDRRIQKRGMSDVEVEHLGTLLASYEQGVSECLGA